MKDLRPGRDHSKVKLKFGHFLLYVISFIQPHVLGGLHVPVL